MMPIKSVINFGAGPACLPQAVLERVQQEWWNWQGSGMNVMEISHRDPLWEETMKNTEAKLRSLMTIPDDYAVLFMQGGGSLQFAAWLMNLVSPEQRVHYLVNGTWSRKAYEEAVKLGYKATQSDGFDSDAPFLYCCDNETVDGIEMAADVTFPAGKWVVSDMSSNFLSRPVQVDRYACIFATAQKNFGVAGVTVVIVRRSLLKAGAKPSMLDYALMEKHGSLYNTPPVMAIYVLSLMLDWIEGEGGLKEMDRRARERSQLLYSFLDQSAYFKNTITLRSRMNVIFHSTDDKAFLQAAKERGMVGLAGHRSVGGLRASLYNAMGLEEVKALLELMKEFSKTAV